MTAEIQTDESALESLHLTTNRPKITKRRLYFDVIYLGTCFAFLFTGFNVCETYITTIFPGSYGYTVLLLIYSCFGISSIAAPSITTYIAGIVAPHRAEQVCMLISTVGYVMFCAALSVKNQVFVSVAAVLCGLSAGILWINQGAWLTRLVKNFESSNGSAMDVGVIGTATGLFFTLFNFSAIIGSIIAIVFLQFGSFIVLIYIMAAVCALGALLMIGTTNVPVYDEPSNSESFNFSEMWKNSLVFLKRPQTLLITPYHFCQGFTLSYSYGNFPTFANYVTQAGNPDASDTLIATNIAIAFLLYGCGSLIGSMVWGPLYDRFKSINSLLVFHVLLVTISFTTLIYTVFANVGIMVPIYIVGFVFGLIDFLTNCITNTTNSNCYDSSEVPLAFSWYRFIFCLGFSLASVVSAVLPGVLQYQVSGDAFGWMFMICLNIAVIIVSVVCGAVMQNVVYRVKKEEMRSLCSGRQSTRT